jgi:hypothetical protein
MNTTAAGYATTYYYPGGPLSAATLSFPPARSPPLIPSGDLAKVGDPTLGYIGAYALDCTGSLAAGVEVSADNADAGVPFHWSGATGQNGGASFYNVPEGPLVLTATPASLGKVSSRVSVYVRAGASTQVVLLPTP